MNYIGLSDFFFVLGVVIIAVVIFQILSGFGNNNALKYLWYWMTDGIRSHDMKKPRMNYYDFLLLEKEKRNNSSNMSNGMRTFSLVIGVAFVIVAAGIAAMC